MNRLPENEKNKIHYAKMVCYRYHTSFYKLDTDRALMHMLIDIERLRALKQWRLYEDFKDFTRKLKKRYPRDEYEKSERDELFYESIMQHFYPGFLNLTDMERNCIKIAEYCEKNGVNLYCYWDDKIYKLLMLAKLVSPDIFRIELS